MLAGEKLGSDGYHYSQVKMRKYVPEQKNEPALKDYEQIRKNYFDRKDHY